MRLLYFFGCLFALVAIGQIKTVATQQIDTTSARLRATNDLKEAVKKNGATMEPIHTKDGIAVVVSTGDAAKLKAIQEAGDQYASASAKIGTTSEHGNMTFVVQRIGGKTITQQVQKTSTGLLIILSSNDAATVEWLQTSGCCDYCVCPAGTVTHCAQCC